MNNPNTLDAPRHRAEARWPERSERHSNVCPGMHCAGRNGVHDHRGGRIPTHLPRPCGPSRWSDPVSPRFGVAVAALWVFTYVLMLGVL